MGEEGQGEVSLHLSGWLSGAKKGTYLTYRPADRGIWMDGWMVDHGGGWVFRSPSASVVCLVIWGGQFELVPTYLGVLWAPGRKHRIHNSSFCRHHLIDKTNSVSPTRGLYISGLNCHLLCSRWLGGPDVKGCLDADFEITQWLAHVTGGWLI